MHVWRRQGRTTATWIPSVVFTAVTFVTGLMALLLPETLNRPLPETIEEIESWTRSANKSLDPQAYSASVTGPKKL